VAVVGAGGAGLSLVVALDRLLGDRRRTHPGAAAPSVLLVDPVHRAGADRTWSFWDDGHSPVEDAVHRSWRRVGVVGRDGVRRVLDLDPMRYVTVRSQDFYSLADAAADRIGARRLVAPVDAVLDGDRHALVHAGGRRVRARWVFDSRPAPPALPAGTALLQHFRGWAVRADGPAPMFDPGVPVLMDFGVPQLPREVAFGYVLPSDAASALVEFTVFSRARRTTAAYEHALRAYLADRYAGHGYTVEAVEDGVIPMTDAVHARRAGRRVFRLGTAGGATRPSTGYTFSAMQRQAAAVAAALLEGREPLPPAPYPARHRWMDAVLLRALDQGHARGDDLFVRLFDRNGPTRVLRFLDGSTTPAQDLALMASSPTMAMTRAAAGNAAARVRRRAAALRPSVP